MRDDADCSSASRTEGESIYITQRQPCPASRVRSSIDASTHSGMEETSLDGMAAAVQHYDTLSAQRLSTERPAAPPKECRIVRTPFIAAENLLSVPDRGGIWDFAIGWASVAGVWGDTV